MKFLDGSQIYDTETATLVDEWRNGSHLHELGATPIAQRLYLSPYGRYFGVNYCATRIPKHVWSPILDNHLLGWLVQNHGEAIAIKHFSHLLEPA